MNCTDHLEVKMLRISQPIIICSELAPSQVRIRPNLPRLWSLILSEPCPYCGFPPNKVLELLCHSHYSPHQTSYLNAVKSSIKSNSPAHLLSDRMCTVMNLLSATGAFQLKCVTRYSLWTLTLHIYSFINPAQITDIHLNIAAVNAARI